MYACAGVNELRGEADAIVTSADTTFKHIAHTELSTKSAECRTVEGYRAKSEPMTAAARVILSCQAKRSFRQRTTRMVAQNRRPLHLLNKRILDSVNMGAAGSWALIYVGDMLTIVPLRRCRKGRGA